MWPNSDLIAVFTVPAIGRLEESFKVFWFHKGLCVDGDQKIGRTILILEDRLTSEHLGAWPLTILKLKWHKLRHLFKLNPCQWIQNQGLKALRLSFWLSPAGSQVPWMLLKCYHFSQDSTNGEYSCCHIRFRFQTDWWDGLVWPTQAASNSAFVQSLDNSKLFLSVDKNFAKLGKLTFN